MKTKFICLLLAILCCGVFAGDRTPAPTNGRDKVTKRKTDRPVYSKLTFVPGFAGSSFYFPDADGKKIEVSFRKAGEGEYKPVLTPSYNRREKLWRGSIVNLEENTCYEVKITKNGKTVATGKFTTMGAPVKIARTIVLNEKNFKGTLEITAKGKPDGWIRYTCAPGFVLKNDRTEPLLVLHKAKYIILDKLVMQGGSHNAVMLNYCSNIRITNCDLSGWGEIKVKQDFDRDGKFYYYRKDGKYSPTNYSAGINVYFGDNILIEKNYIHDPAGHSNSWRYSHPAGPCAIFVVCPTSTTIRYNDLVASDTGRWNDAVEGLYNFNEDGGFNRDAEIYGNFMIYCQDDNIELDGGQQNVRCFGNRFEASYCGVSIQGCMSGPCYVYNNMFINNGDEFGKSGQNIKTSTKGSGLDAIAYILNNSFSGGGTGFNMNKYLRAVVKNNVYDRSYISGTANMKKSGSVSDYNLLPPDGENSIPGKNGVIGKAGYVNAAKADLNLAADSPAIGKGCVIPNFTAEKDVDMGAFLKKAPLPLRPMPVVLDAGKLNFTVSGGKSAAQTVTAKVGCKNYSSRFRVVIPRANNWLEVTPAEGVFESGRSITFTVKVKPELMKERTIYRGAFLLRQDNGLARPVSVYADTDFHQAARLHKDGDFALYINSEDYKVSGGKVEVINDKYADGGKALRMFQSKDNKPFEYEFEVPRDGKYHLMLRCRSGHRPRVQIAIDDQKLADSALHIMPYWSWATSGYNCQWGRKVKVMQLKAGKHTLKLLPLGWKDIDLIAITDNPGAYEPR